MEDSFQIEGIDARVTVTRHKVAKVFWFFFQKELLASPSVGTAQS